MVKCYTKKRKPENGGGNYTTCIGFQKGGKAKPKTIKIKRKKKKVKGVMTIEKKIKTTRKLKNKSTIKPPLTKSKVKPKPKTKLMKGGKAVLMGLPINMKIIGQYAITKEERERRGRIAEKELDRMFNRLKNKNEALFHNNITANYSNIAGLKRTIKGREKVLKQYKKKTENYKLIMRKKYKSPRQRGRFGSETAFRSDGVKMLESIISDLKQRLKERTKKK